MTPFVIETSRLRRWIKPLAIALNPNCMSFFFKVTFALVSWIMTISCNLTISRLDQFRLAWFCGHHRSHVPHRVIWQLHVEAAAGSLCCYIIGFFNKGLQVSELLTFYPASWLIHQFSETWLVTVIFIALSSWHHTPKRQSFRIIDVFLLPSSIDANWT